MPALRFAKRIMIAIAGFTVIIIGVVMIPLPGPGALVILAGLSILALEFAWARRLLVRAKEAMEKARARFKRKPKETVTSPEEPKTMPTTPPLSGGTDLPIL
ncbi:MAG: PGPGW domain-containing protein [Chthoniobacteraceae bacterium]